VQLQTLTAVVKLFLRKPETSQGLVQKVLNTATKDCDSPDVRDRAYIYWRLLSTDPGAAKVWAPIGAGCCCSKSLIGRDLGSSTADIHPENKCFPGTFGRAHQRNVDLGQCVPQTRWYFHRTGSHWRRFYAKEGRVRVHILKLLRSCRV
jgi:hypothetical protein